MALDPRIILAGQTVDVAGAMARGNELAMQTNQLRDQNAMRDLYRTQGAGIVAGDPNAINALAMIDPNAALGIQDARMGMEARKLDMQATRQRMDMLARDEQRQIAAFKAQATAAEAQAAAQRIEEAVKMGLAIPDAATWDRLMAERAPELVGQFDNRQAFAMKYMSMAEALKASQGPEPVNPVKGAPSGYMFTDPNNPAAGVTPLPGYKPQPGVVVNNGGGSDKQVFDAMIVDRDAARSAVSGYNALAEAKKAVDSGIISGFGADNILALQKLGAALGVVDPAAIQNTETFRSAIAPQVAAVLRSVAGTANLSNSDREFAEKAAGGSIALDDGSIKRLLTIMEKASRSSIEGYMSRLDAVYPDQPEFQRERAILGITPPQFVDMTAPPPPALQPSAAPSGVTGGVQWRIVE